MEQYTYIVHQLNLLGSWGSVSLVSEQCIFAILEMTFKKKTEKSEKKTIVGLFTSALGDFLIVVPKRGSSQSVTVAVLVTDMRHYFSQLALSILPEICFPPISNDSHVYIFLRGQFKQTVSTRENSH